MAVGVGALLETPTSRRILLACGRFLRLRSVLPLVRRKTGDMADPTSDPNLHWDGTRWLRWDGQMWRDATTGQAPAATDAQVAATGQTYAAPGTYRTNLSVLGVRPGMLHATVGGPASRLTFTANDGEVLFDGPLDSFHSPGLTEWDSTLVVWQGDKRHRINMTPGGPLLGNMAGPYVSTTDASRWLAVLAPAVGTPPAGVKVRKPMGRTGYTWLLVGVVVAAFVLASVIVFGLG